MWFTLVLTCLCFEVFCLETIREFDNIWAPSVTLFFPKYMWHFAIPLHVWQFLLETRDFVLYKIVTALKWDPPIVIMVVFYLFSDLPALIIWSLSSLWYMDTDASVFCVLLLLLLFNICFYFNSGFLGITLVSAWLTTVCVQKPRATKSLSPCHWICVFIGKHIQSLGSY